LLTEQEIYDRIIWSADVADPDTMLDILEQVPKLRHVKVDRLFVEQHGPAIFDHLAEGGVKAFYDAKYIEIPDKLEKLANVGCGFNPWMLNCMAGALSTGQIEAPKPDEIDGLKRFADVCLGASVRPCGVTVLTSKEDKVVEGEFHGRGSVEQVLFYAEELLQCGFTDVVCSAEEVASIRSESCFDGLKLSTPGIRRPGSSSDDQARKKSPVGALQAGSTYLVIGRNITEGDDPAQNLNDLVAEVQAA
jgi:orotidine-5'-phosphate decarboxylase